MHYLNFLMLSIKWNRLSIAKNFLSNNTIDDNSDLDQLFQVSILLDKPDFAQFFLSCGADIKSLTKQDFYLLYNFKEKVFDYISF